MAKVIEERFSIDINGQPYHIIARSYNNHWFRFFRHGKNAEVCLTTDDMRKLGQHLIQTADKIDDDPDFNSKLKTSREG